MIDINKKRLSIFLLIISAIFFSAVYWGLYEFISFNFLEIPVAAMNFVDLFVIFAYLIAGTPAVFGLRKLCFFILTKEPKDN